MKKENVIKKIKAGIPFGLMAVSFVVVMMVLSNTTPIVVDEPPVAKTERVKFQRISLPPVGEADPSGTNASGVLEIYLIINASSPNYDTNVSNSSGYYLGRYGPNLNTLNQTNGSHYSSDVNYSVPHDIVIKVRWNKTHAYETTNHTWMLQYVRANITCTYHGLSNTVMSETNISSTTNGQYIWVNYYVGPYSIARSDNVTGVDITFDAFF